MRRGVHGSVFDGDSPRFEGLVEFGGVFDDDGVVSTEGCNLLLYVVDEERRSHKNASR